MNEKSTAPSGAEAEVWQTVQALNEAWTGGRVDELARYFHPEMMAVTPADRERLDGQAACVASWRRFVQAAEIVRWEARDPRVRLFGDTAAVVGYTYELACDVGGEHRVLRGRDLMFLVQEAGRWWLAGDQFSPFPG
ncbi:MAG: nuclear transport factor 2 family protein [Candidatus Schekmanbacteria bacterium]|nr:nuclear transport factor 2 family protein [Candidatus Schekmanbacteria bacterium]